jgi:formate-dependent nitrite reductase membrane component NrfD
MTSIYWNITIAFYLFSAGVSAGALIVSIIAGMINREKYARTVKLGALIAPFPVMLGTLALIFDLERPLRFWMLMISFEPTSVMSVGAWILMAFSFISLLFFYPHIPDRFDILGLKQRMAKVSSMRAVRIAGLIFALATALYTGVLLNGLSARPFWDTMALPLVFLFSAVIDGIAAILLLMYLLSQPDPDRNELAANRSFLGKFDLAFLVLLIISMTIMLLSLYFSGENTSQALSIIMGGSMTAAFWLGVVIIGMLAPLAHNIFEVFAKDETEEKSRNRLKAMLVTVSVLVGGFLLRYVIVYAGQLTGPIIN